MLSLSLHFNPFAWSLPLFPILQCLSFFFLFLYSSLPTPSSCSVLLIIFMSWKHIFKFVSLLIKLSCFLALKFSEFLTWIIYSVKIWDSQIFLHIIFIVSSSFVCLLLLFCQTTHVYVIYWQFSLLLSPVNLDSQPNNNYPNSHQTFLAYVSLSSFVFSEPTLTT